MFVASCSGFVAVSRAGGIAGDARRRQVTAGLGPGGRAGVTLLALAAGVGNQESQSPAAAIGSRGPLLSLEVPDLGHPVGLCFLWEFRLL